MEYRRSDFSGCLYNPILDDSIFSEYPEFWKLVPDSLRTEPDIEEIGRYVVMCYDPASMLVKDHGDVQVRKQTIITHLGINPDRTKELVANSNNQINVLISGFLLKLKNRKWAAIVAIEMCYWESIAKLMEPINEVESTKILAATEKKSKIKAEIRSDMDTLDKLYTEFFAGDTPLVDELLKPKRKISPEGIHQIR